MMMVQPLARLQWGLCHVGAKHQFEIQNGCAWIYHFSPPLLLVIYQLYKGDEMPKDAAG